MKNEMVVLRAGTTPVFELPGIRFQSLAAPSRGSAQLCTWLLTLEAELQSPEPHTLDRDEIFMVVDGALRLSNDGDVLGPGDVAVVPAGVPIQVANPGQTPAQAYVVLSAGFTATAADGTTIGTPPWAQ